MLKYFATVIFIAIQVITFPFAVYSQSITPKLGWYKHVQPVRPGFGSGYDMLMVKIVSNNPLPAKIDSIKYSVNIRCYVYGVGCAISSVNSTWSFLPPYASIDPVTNCFLQTPSGCSDTYDVRGCLFSSESMSAKLFYCNSSPSCKDSIDFDILVGVEDQLANEVFPAEFQLYENYPNPFNQVTTIQFELLKPEHVLLRIFNITGEEIAILANKELSEGTHTIPWNAENLPSGVYYYRLETSEFAETKRLVLIK